VKILGISEGFHDAAIAVVDSDSRAIEFATHTERYTRIKNDPSIPNELLNSVPHDFRVYYEDISLKNQRRMQNGQSPVYSVNAELADDSVSHHESHAAAAYYTSPFDPSGCVIAVIDAIGEWATATIWKPNPRGLVLVEEKRYPFSIGLFYSAITKRIGLRPNEDEYITMGMAAFGNPCIDMGDCFNRNLHRGFSLNDFKGHRPEDIAASAQAAVEAKIIEFISPWRKLGHNLCYGGGVALNCVANSKLAKHFDNIWIMPSPGDAGSSLGAALGYLKQKVHFQDTYLGYNIDRPINPREVAQHLASKGVAGVAHGKAEFGPRALGNRSLLGDPRIPDIKKRLNNIKRRQKFRPFAPAILSEWADNYFDGPKNEYMQFVARAKHSYEGVTHVDGTARVQVVPTNSNSALRQILEEFYEITGVPMLLNTSLNIKGQPMVNSEQDALDFEKKYKVKVF
jgi:carbamoyltransferase